MTAKTKGRLLPPLLPLEYCSIERAARMLECEKEDILHWFEVGAINLYLKVDMQDPGVLVLNQLEYQELLKIGKKTENYSHTGSYRFGLSDLFISEDINNAGFNDDLYYLNVSYLQGLWLVDFSDLEHALSTGKDTFSIFGLIADTENNIDATNLIDRRTVYFSVDLDEETEFKFSQLQVARRDLEKLYSVITTGESLPNRINTPEIAAEFAKRNGQLSSNRPAENNSRPRTAALVSMCELFKKTKKLKTEIKPDELQTEINKELLKHGIAEIEGQRIILKAYNAADK